MRTFTDKLGRPWEVAIDIAACKRVRDLLGVDVTQAFSAGFDVYAKLAGDQVLFVDVLYVLCRQQAERAGISDEDFGRAFNGDVIEAAWKAFSDELLDFFPSARRMMLGLLIERIEKITSMAESEARKILEEMLGGSSLNSPASSASTPAPSP